MRVLGTILLGLLFLVGWSQAPLFQSGTPAPGAVNVPLSTTQIVLVFSDPYALIGYTSQIIVVNTSTNTNVPGTTTWSHDTFTNTTTLTFTIAGTLSPNTTYKVLPDGIVGANNTPLTIPNFPNPYLFTTECPFNFVSGTPIPGATNVPVTTTVQLQFSCPLSTTSEVVLLDGATPVAGTSVVSGNTITFTPSTPLNYNTTYTVSASNITDGFGNPPSGFPTVYQFTTQAPPPLNFVSSVPPANATNVNVNTSITLTFDQPLSSASTITVSSTSGTVVGTIVVTGSSLTFTPSAPLNFNTVYTVNFAGVRSSFGVPPSGTTTFTFTTQPPPTVQLISSSPSAGATGVARNSSIVLNFNGAIDPTSTFTIRGRNIPVPGTIRFSNGNQTVTFNPNAPLDPATTYTVDFSTLQTELGGPLLGPYTFTFTTEGGARILGTTVPQTAQAGANERLTLSYFLRNQSSISANITGSTLYYYLPNGTLLAQVAQPVSGALLPNGTLSVAGEVQIDEAFVQSARSAGFDTLLIVRVFTGQDANNNPLTSLTDTPAYSGFVGNPALFGQGVVIVTPVRLLSSLSAGVRVRDITITFPTDTQIVPRNTPLGARALIQVTGNGTVVGRWLVNGVPVESFTASAVAGLPIEVSTQRSLPTLNIGEQRVELEVISPDNVHSRIVRYIVSGFVETGVPRPVTPRRGAVISARELTELVYRWQVVSGASGYEVGFATSLSALGLGVDGRPLEIAPDAFSPASLLVYRRIDNPATNSLRLTEAEYERIVESGSGVVFWTVRPLFPPGNTPLPAQTAPPSWVVVVESEAELALASPNPNEVVSLETLTFRWEPMGTGAGTLYLLEVFPEGDAGTPILQALVSEPRYDYDPLVPMPLLAGRTYQWRVQAIVPGVGAVAVSEVRTFRVRESNQARLFITRLAPYHRLIGLQAQVEFSPADGATVSTQQPTIRVRFTDAQPGKVRLYLDNVDMSRLATFSDTEVVFEPPRVLEPGEHEILLVYLNRAGQRSEARARFRIELRADQPVQTESQQPDSELLQVLAQLRLQLDTQFLAQSEDFTWENLTQSLTTDGSYGVRADEVEGSIEVTGIRPPHARYDVNRLLGTFSYRGERFQSAIGDVGVDASAFTVSGLGTRAFQTRIILFNGLRFSYTKTVGPIIGRTGLGSHVNMWVATLETADFAKGRGIRIIRTENLQSYSGFGSSISGSGLNTFANVWSIVGQYPLSPTVRVQAEVARSQNRTPTVGGGTAYYRGDARTLSLQAQLSPSWNASLNYRNIAASFRSPASATLSSDLIGWDTTLSGRLNPFVSLSAQFGLLRNESSATSPRSENSNWGLNLSLNFPRLVPIQLSYRQTDSKSDPLVGGGRRSKIRDQQYTVGTQFPIGKLDTFLSYTFARFNDYEDVVDPTTDIPNDRETRFVTVGVGWRGGNLSLRADWSDNRVRRSARDPFLLNLFRGDDLATNFRIQSEYLLAPGLSLSGSYATADQRDLLRIGIGKLKDYNLRLNWTPANFAGGRFQFSIEWRQSERTFGGNTTTDTLWVFLLNDSRLFSLR